MDDGALFLSLYVVSVSVNQAGVTCTSFFLLTTQLEGGNWRKRVPGCGSFSPVATFKLCK